MPKDKHESVSSETSASTKCTPAKPPPHGHEAETDESSLYESVSGEGQTPPAQPARDEVAESFDGSPKVGELEQVEGFDESRAFQEGMPAAIVTDEFASLTEHQPEEYPYQESVCGHDDRTRISPCTAPPWRWICQLIITMANGSRSRCTGWFIGPRTVMTAGHCVYSRGAGGWARQIEVIPGLDGASRPYGSQVGTSFRSVTGWTGNGDPNFDYGAIILPNNNLGNTVGYFGFANLSDASLQNLLVNNSGYPGDKPYGTQWFNAGRVTTITARKLYYMLDTYGGQSGSSVWRYLNGQRHAVGIHAYGGCPNSATRINAPVFANMLAWRNLA